MSAPPVHPTPTPGTDRPQPGRRHSDLYGSLRRLEAARPPRHDPLFQLLPIPLSLVDRDGRQIAGNTAYAALFRMDPDELAGFDTRTLTPAEDRMATVEVLEQVAAGELESITMEKRYRRPEGTEFIGRLTTTAMRNDSGEATGFIGVIEDVTRLRETEQALRAGTRRFRTLVMHLSDRVLLVDDDGIVLDVMCTTVAADPSRANQLLGAPFEQLVLPEDRPVWSELWELAVSAPGTHVRRQLRMLSPDGEHRDHECDAVSLFHDPDVQGMLVTARDIGDRNQVLRELALRRDEAERASSDRSAFVASVSHELRNPLHAMLGLTELLAASDELPGDSREMAKALHRQAGAMRRILDDLLDLSRMQMRVLELHAERTVVRSVVEQVVEPFRIDSARRGLVLEWSVHPSVPQAVEMDGGRLAQILQNLVGNACKFTRQGAVRVTVTPALRERMLRIEVADTGEGIPLDRQHILFEPFTQVIPQRDTKRGGAGLGLAIVRNLAQMMGGDVGVRSAPGMGSTFWVDVAYAPAAADPGDQHEEEAHARGWTALVVEDNPVNRLLTVKQLERLGVTAQAVGSGTAALEAMERHTFDLVFMDYQLPDLDGIEVTRRQRRREAVTEQHVPIVGLTASAMAADRTACLDAGMDDFLSKPAGLNDLRRILDRLAAARDGVIDGAAAEDRDAPDADAAASPPGRARRWTCR